VVRTVTHREQDITTTQLKVVEVVVEQEFHKVQVHHLMVTVVVTTQVVMVDQEMDVDPLKVAVEEILATMAVLLHLIMVVHTGVEVQQGTI
jgi:hypothetical protein